MRQAPGSEDPGRRGFATEAQGSGHREAAGRLTGVERREGGPGEARGRRARAGGTGDGGVPAAGVGFPRVRGARWGKGRRRDSGSGQSPGPELPYLKRFSDLPWQRSPRLPDLALRKFYSPSSLNVPG